MLSGPVTIFGINPFAEETVPSHQLGASGVTADGRKFRYARAGVSALVAGELQQAVVQTTGNQSRLTAAATIGATEVTTTDTVTMIAGQYVDGWMVVTGEGGTGAGYAYRIKAHPVVATAVVTVTLAEPLKVALTTASQVDFVENPYSGVVQNTTSASSAPIGVAMLPMTASSYGWLQTSGPGLVKTDASGSVTVGLRVTASNQTAGCVEDGDAYTQPAVGVALTGIAQAEFGLVNLCIE